METTLLKTSLQSDDRKLARLGKMQRRPSTPGALLMDLMECNQLTQGEVATRLQVSRATVNRIIGGHRAITPDLAHRLGRLFGNGPAIWVKFQQQVDLWDTLHLDDSQFQQIEPLTQTLP